MRRCTLRAVPVCFVVFACGCFLTGGNHGSGQRPGMSLTQYYWAEVGNILARKPDGKDFVSMVNLVRLQTDRLRELRTEGVDPDLVAAVDKVIKCEEEVLRQAEMIDNDPARLKTSKEQAHVFADANRAAADAKKRVKALQPTLNTRHGGGFVALGG